MTLAREQAIGQVPPETGFGTFVGAAGFFASVFGMAALWFDQINGKILISLDTLVSVFYLAGAIVCFPVISHYLLDKAALLLVLLNYLLIHMSSPSL